MVVIIELPHNDLSSLNCSYSSSLNDPENGMPGHWDLGVLLTGLDLFDPEWSARDYGTLGVARRGAMCHSKFSCVVTEFAVTTTRETGSPDPTAGFGGVYVLAHEIGHSLGMKHDGSGNECDFEGFLMSATRETYGGETKWSKCSANSLKYSSATYCLGNSPDKPLFTGEAINNRIGRQVFKPDFQCQVFLRDETAFALAEEKNICSSLSCGRDDNGVESEAMRSFKAGPALDGTPCNANGICSAGDCNEQFSFRDQGQDLTDYLIQLTRKSDWHYGRCASGCIKRSRGFRNSTRFCLDDVPDCEDEVRVELCSDDEICRNSGSNPVGAKRVSRKAFATQQCQRIVQKASEAKSVLVSPKRSFADGSLEIEPMPSIFVKGMPAIFKAERKQQACEIYCKVLIVGPQPQFEDDDQDYRTWARSLREASRTTPWKSPLADLKRQGREAEAFFPDGTWCHRDSTGTDYFCVNHECVAEDDV